MNTVLYGRLDKSKVSLLLVGCEICFLISILLILVLHLITPNYNPILQQISEFALYDYGVLLTGAMLVLGIGSILLTIVLGSILPKNNEYSMRVILSLVIWSVGVIIAGLIPIDPTFPLTTFNGLIHSLVAIIAFIAFPTAIFAVYQISQQYSSLPYKSASLKVLAGIVGITLLTALFSPNEVKGLTQRIFLSTVMITLYYLSMKLLWEINDLPIKH